MTETPGERALRAALAVERAIDRVGVENGCPAIREAARYSARRLGEIAALLGERAEEARLDVDGSAIDVVAFGSLARVEASSVSDLDYLVVVQELPADIQYTRQLLRITDEVRSKLENGAPGGTRTFGKVVSAADLTERIGLAQDTNESHTHRILLLEESASLLRPDLHDRLLRAIIDRYLADYSEPKVGVPRFLLNDVLRYWRTISVDYQAKRWDPLDDGWGLRYLKLITTRKLAFAGTLAALFTLPVATADALVAAFADPPLARLARLTDHGNEQTRLALRHVFEIANEVMLRLGQDEFREAAKAIPSPAEISSHPRVEEVRQLARELQGKLEVAFFDGGGNVAKYARKYLSF